MLESIMANDLRWSPLLKTQSDLRDTFAACFVVQHVGPRVDCGFEKPVLAGFAVQLVQSLVVVNGERSEEIRAVPATAGGASEMVDSIRVTQVQATPFRTQCGQG